MFPYSPAEQPIQRKLANLNWFLIFLILMLAMVGFFMLYSAAGGSFHPWLKRQLVYFFVFFTLMLFIAVIDISFWFKSAYLFYFIALVGLILVAIKGHNSMGATRWV
ncbi:MAG: FtsW/RodA/SpoVE family cell cycle protein, partial [Proteobacteria bacterium]|nr:FtsW/RodA/SpoVE family cell cycle protein [Pseudomonadota bacterium]